ncbi:MAG: zinc-binding dehydrogenase [Chloroflexi bacterium]|nr:zinc-binding dehydrogenase [Chloroflexota bacterium]
MAATAAGMMWRVAKHEGVGNVVLEHVPIPEPGPGQVLVRTQVSLISRGSELWRRYEREEAIDPGMMGYSTTGVVVRAGEGVAQVGPGDRVVVTAPHAEYSVRSVQERGRPWVFPLDGALSFDEGTFHPLSTSSAGWTQAARITPRDRVVVLGQGIVGNLVMQFARRYRPAQLIAVDALDLRCRLSREAGAPEVINAAEEEPVAAVRRLTGGAGAAIVFDCVGGRAGVQSFAQAQEMLAPGGLLQLIGLYHGAPLPLDASKMMGKRLLGGYPPETDRAVAGQEAMQALAAGAVRVQPLITHRFAGHEAKQAFDFLYEHPDQAMGVLLIWG